MTAHEFHALGVELGQRVFIELMYENREWAVEVRHER